RAGRGRAYLRSAHRAGQGLRKCQSTDRADSHVWEDTDLTLERYEGDFRGILFAQFVVAAANIRRGDAFRKNRLKRGFVRAEQTELFLPFGFRLESYILKCQHFLSPSSRDSRGSGRCRRT